MSDTDPFADAAFNGRLQKLLPMLGSEQPGEADAARRKIAEHLATHRLSYTDLANHLRDRNARNAPSFSQGARELSLERQLTIARAAKEEAAHEAQSALNRVRSLEIELQQATFDIARTLTSQARVRGAAAIACMVAAGCLIFVVLPHGRDTATAQAPPVSQQSIIYQPSNAQTESTAHLAPNERAGHAAVSDLAVKLSPTDQAPTRTFLNYGAPVVIQNRMIVGPQTWLLIRSESGNGWVRSGDIVR